jgi:hypothetical protein
MKPRHLIAIVLIGTSLIVIAPTSDKSGHTDKTIEPAHDVAPVPVEDKTGPAKLQPATFKDEARIRESGID